MKHSRIKFVRLPQAQRRHCELWLKEWSLYELGQAVAGGEQPHLPVVAASADKATTTEASVPTWLQPATMGPDSLPAVGDIRLLYPDLIPHVSVPSYCAIISGWEDGLFLATQFSPFLWPATMGELLTGRKEYPLRVICPWSTATLSPFLLGRSWLVGKLAARELRETRQVFKHAVTGKAIPKSLEHRVGAPIVHPLDPRIVYQRMLAAVLAPLVKRTAGEIESTVTIPWVSASHETVADGGLKRAAKDCQSSGHRESYKCSELSLDLDVYKDTRKSVAHFEFSTSAGQAATRARDLSILCRKTGKVVPVVKGKASVNRADLLAGFTLLLKDTPVQLLTAGKSR